MHILDVDRRGNHESGRSQLVFDNAFFGVGKRSDSPLEAITNKVRQKSTLLIGSRTRIVIITRFIFVGPRVFWR